MMISQAETQVAFNLKKGSLPVRGDVDLAAANDCMKKGLEILDDRATSCPTPTQLIDRGHHQPDQRPVDEFFTDPSMTPEDAQKRFADIIAEAPTDASQVARHASRPAPLPPAGRSTAARRHSCRTAKPVA